MFDVICSFLALIVLSPVLLVTAILVRIKLGTPVIFKQKRPGLHEKIFTLYKFRTMTDQKDEQGNLLSDEVRLTKFGKMLRSTSLDELPELWNILKGNMSIVGPRPLLERYIPLYTAEQRKRHQVRPGLTGLAQVNGRNELNWKQKFQLDTEYTIRITFISDIKIILQTIGHVFTGKGISSTTSATMEEFTGNPKN
ncbi:sugar transferase [uncultured Sphaerochaeta sp.]|uniref:sugar transferase n=1 Tax=uncultured Sphaerochaeta sp. TaxID=886478 RepID=UPI002AA87EBD|nr:sugar transferase [uncultured Sphaerochaeta sp.]